jgi:hypothetical protein
LAVVAILVLAIMILKGNFFFYQLLYSESN